MDNVDKTIDALCDWIQENLKLETSVEKSVVAEMTKALAELVATKKELQAIQSYLESRRFVPEDSNGKHEGFGSTNQKYFP